MIIIRADHAMYRAKQTGRNQVLPFSEHTDSADRRSVTWQHAL